MADVTKGTDTKQAITPVTTNIEDIEAYATKDAVATAPQIAEAPKRGWRSYIWDSLDKRHEERRLVFKVDCALLTIGCLSELSKLSIYG